MPRGALLDDEDQLAVVADGEATAAGDAAGASWTILSAFSPVSGTQPPSG
jgi:hypothetical protein